MSFLLTCPNCGPRDVSEFRYGGQILDRPTRVLATRGEGEKPGSSAIKVEGPTRGGNLPGRQRERWYHAFGCRCWLVAERDVRTNEVFHTGWLGEEAL